MEEDKNGARQTVVIPDEGQIYVGLVYNEIIEAVRREASYIGSKSVAKDDAGAYKRISITDGDLGMIDVYWRESISEMTMALHPYKIDYSDSYEPDVAGDVTLLITYAKGFDEVQWHDVEAAMSQYIKARILFKWLSYTASSLAANYATAAQEALVSIRWKLSARAVAARENVSKENKDVKGKPAAVTGGASKANGDGIQVGRTWKDASGKRRHDAACNVNSIELITGEQ